jgi:hypothetical protein
MRAGGTVTWMTSSNTDGFGRYVHRIDGDLSLSRALGDFRLKANPDLPPQEQKVSSLPEVFEYTARCGDTVILACDGVFDVLTSSQVCIHATAASHLREWDINLAAKAVTDLALRDGSTDNVTCIICRLDTNGGELPEPEPRASSRFSRLNPGNTTQTERRRGSSVRARSRVEKAPSDVKAADAKAADAKSAPAVARSVSGTEKRLSVSSFASEPSSSVSTSEASRSKGKALIKKDAGDATSVTREASEKEVDPLKLDVGKVWDQARVMGSREPSDSSREEIKNGSVPVFAV